MIGFALICEFPVDIYHPEMYPDYYNPETFTLTTHPEDNSHIPFFKEPFNLEHIWIDKEYRRKGYGLRMIKYITKMYECLILPSNNASRKLMEKSGLPSYGTNGIGGNKFYRSY